MWRSQRSYVGSNRFKKNKKRINRYGTTDKGLAWESKKNNNLRYTEIAKLIKTKFNSKINILDFGCGISGLYKF